MTDRLRDHTAGWSPLGDALLDYHHGDTQAEIVVSSELWEDESTPVEVFYRSADRALPTIDRKALDLCRGRILDLGAGGGRHALELQASGHTVVAVDLLGEAVDIMIDRGVIHARQGNLDAAAGERFDTVLMLMHGLGVVGDVSGLGRFLEQLPTFLNPGGQLICDSADLAVVLEEESPGLADELSSRHRYLGEVEFRLRYGSTEGPPYPWIFVDFEALAIIAHHAGFDASIAAEGERGSYLAVLSLRTS